VCKFSERTFLEDWGMIFEKSSCDAARPARDGTVRGNVQCVIVAGLAFASDVDVLVCRATGDIFFACTLVECMNMPRVYAACLPNPRR
jgi:hypothetical protein